MAYRRLPAAPNLEKLKNLAKRLLAAYRDGEEQAVAEFAEFHPHAVSATEAQLTDAQLVLARSYGHPSWPRLASAAQVQRSLHDDDVEALQRVVAEHPEALSEYLSSTNSGWPTSRAGFGESTRVKQRNVDRFLRTFAKDIPLDELTADLLDDDSGFEGLSPIGPEVQTAQDEVEVSTMEESS